MAAPWNENENRILVENIVDGFPVQRMKDLIPDREIGGIKQKAQLLGYGVKTSKIDDMARFYSGINTRNRGSNVSTENDEPIGIVDTLGEAQPTTASQSNSFEHLESEAKIIAHDGFTANELAVKILRDNRLKANPDIIYQLSLHILKEQL